MSTSLKRVAYEEGIGTVSLKDLLSRHNVKSLRALIADHEIWMKYNEIGRFKSPLGRPISGLRETDQGFQTLYRGGTINSLSNQGTFVNNDRQTIVKFKGLHCFGQSQGIFGLSSGTSEPYVGIGLVYADNVKNIITKKFPRDESDDYYEDIDDGSSRPENYELWVGPPSTLEITATVMEHNTGKDPNDLKGLVKDVMSKLTERGLQEAGADPNSEFGEIAMNKINEVSSDFQGDLSRKLAAFFKLSDQLIGTKWFQVMGTELYNLLEYPRPLQNYKGIEFNYETDLITDGDASYKAYFEITTQSI